MQRLTLAGQDRGVHRLGEQGVAEAEPAGRLDGDQNAMVNRVS